MASTTSDVDAKFGEFDAEGGSRTGLGGEDGGGGGLGGGVGGGTSTDFVTLAVEGGESGDGGSAAKPMVEQQEGGGDARQAQAPSQFHVGAGAGASTATDVHDGVEPEIGDESQLLASLTDSRGEVACCTDNTNDS